MLLEFRAITAIVDLRDMAGFPKSGHICKSGHNYLHKVNFKLLNIKTKIFLFLLSCQSLCINIKIITATLIKMNRLHETLGVLHIVELAP